MSSKFMSENDASDYLGIPSRTLASWRFKQKGPNFFKFNTAIRYAQDQLDEFIESGRSERGAS
jgi:hypothetical protein